MLAIEMQNTVEGGFSPSRRKKESWGFSLLNEDNFMKSEGPKGVGKSLMVKDVLRKLKTVALLQESKLASTSN